MKSFLYVSLVALLAASLGGCIVNGQIILTESFGGGVTTDDILNKEVVDLNSNSDYAEHKDDIKSVDAISVVASIKNNLPTDAKAHVYISDDPSFTTVEEVKAGAELVFVSPTIPGDGSLLVDWADGFMYMVDEKPVIDQVLGDGIFTVYVIGNVADFDLDYKAEVTITLTVGK
ncbi:MAG: hypothetical protein JSW58_03190 [Candidatus Latescibacterota bacterium]|nr:MAG: hypothetical protein JSW58_03190 [Candidatus Latescibacterota bacterium]